MKKSLLMLLFFCFSVVFPLVVGQNQGAAQDSESEIALTGEISEEEYISSVIEKNYTTMDES